MNIGTQCAATSPGPSVGGPPARRRSTLARALRLAGPLRAWAVGERDERLGAGLRSLPEEVAEGRRVHRSGEQVALAVAAAESVERIDLVGPLDPLGDHLEAEG